MSKVRRSGSRASNLWRALLAGAMLLPVALPHEASAAFPGTNGPIYFSKYAGGVKTVDSRGGRVNRVTASGFDPEVSPDGRSLLYERPDDSIWLRGLRSRHKQMLLSPESLAKGASWSPTGTQIGFSRSAVGRHSAIWIMNADGTGAHQVTGLDGWGNKGLFDYEPAWSPDGKQIVFSRVINDEGFTRSEIFSVDLRTLEVRRLTYTGRRSGSGWADFSPNGRWIVFSRISRDSSQIARMRPSGRKIQILRSSRDQRQGASVRYVEQPVYSPNGRKIALLADDVSGQKRLALMRSNGKRFRYVLGKRTRDSVVSIDWAPKP